jgi:hypothetical protein
MFESLAHGLRAVCLRSAHLWRGKRESNMAKKKSVPEIALCWNQSQTSLGGTTDLTVSIRVLRNEAKPGEEPAWRNCSDSFNDHLPEYSDLALTCFARLNDNQEPYGWTLCYLQPYRVDLGNVERMHKTLKTIQRKLDAMTENEGCATSFGQYVVRFARAIGARKILFWRGDTGMYSTDTYTSEEIRYMAHVVDRRINEWMHPSISSVA